MINFFNNNFSKYLIELSGNPINDAKRAISSTYPSKSMLEKHTLAMERKRLEDERKIANGVVVDNGKKRDFLSSRITSGWAVVSEKPLKLQCELLLPNIVYESKKNRFQAFFEALENFDGNPIMLLEFDKKPIPVENLFRTLDVRHVCICSKYGVEVFDYTKEPTKESCLVHKQLWKLKKEGK